jgi:hypothetical protein
MPKYVEVDGEIVEFPDDMTDGQMAIAVRRAKSGSPSARPGTTSEYLGRTQGSGEPETSGSWLGNNLRLDETSFGDVPQPTQTFEKKIADQQSFLRGGQVPGVPEDQKKKYYESQAIDLYGSQFPITPRPNTPVAMDDRYMPELKQEKPEFLRPGPSYDRNPVKEAVTQFAQSPEAQRLKSMQRGPMVDPTEQMRWARNEFVDNKLGEQAEYQDDSIMGPLGPHTITESAVASTANIARSLPSFLSNATDAARYGIDKFVPGVAPKPEKTKLVDDGSGFKPVSTLDLLNEGVQMEPHHVAAREREDGKTGFLELASHYLQDPAALPIALGEQAPQFLASAAVGGVAGGAAKLLGRGAVAGMEFAGAAPKAIKTVKDLTTGAAKIIGGGAAYGVPMAMESQEVSDWARDYEKTTGVKLDPEMKALAVTTSGVIGGLLEHMGVESGLGALWDKLSPAAKQRALTSFAGRYGGMGTMKAMLGAIGEGSTEAMQSFVSNISKQQLGYEGPLTAGMVQSALLGAIIGTGASFTESAMSGDTIDTELRKVRAELQHKQDVEAATKAQTAIMNAPAQAAETFAPAQPQPTVPTPGTVQPEMGMPAQQAPAPEPIPQEVAPQPQPAPQEMAPEIASEVPPAPATEVPAPSVSPEPVVAPEALQTQNPEPPPPQPVEAPAPEATGIPEDTAYGTPLLANIGGRMVPVRALSPVPGTKLMAVAQQDDVEAKEPILVKFSDLQSVAGQKLAEPEPVAPPAPKKQQKAVPVNTKETYTRKSAEPVAGNAYEINETPSKYDGLVAGDLVAVGPENAAMELAGFGESNGSPVALLRRRDGVIYTSSSKLIKATENQVREYRAKTEKSAENAAKREENAAEAEAKSTPEPETDEPIDTRGIPLTSDQLKPSNIVTPEMEEYNKQAAEKAERARAYIAEQEAKKKGESEKKEEAKPEPEQKPAPVAEEKKIEEPVVKEEKATEPAAIEQATAKEEAPAEREFIDQFDMVSFQKDGRERKGVVTAVKGKGKSIRTVKFQDGGKSVEMDFTEESLSKLDDEGNAVKRPVKPAPPKNTPKAKQEKAEAKEEKKTEPKPKKPATAKKLKEATAKAKVSQPEPSKREGEEGGIEEKKLKTSIEESELKTSIPESTSMKEPSVSETAGELKSTTAVEETPPTSTPAPEPSVASEPEYQKGSVVKFVRPNGQNGIGVIIDKRPFGTPSENRFSYDIAYTAINPLNNTSKTVLASITPLTKNKILNEVGPESHKFEGLPAEHIPLVEKALGPAEAAPSAAPAKSADKQVAKKEKSVVAKKPEPAKTDTDEDAAAAARIKAVKPQQKEEVKVPLSSIKPGGFFIVDDNDGNRTAAQIIAPGKNGGFRVALERVENGKNVEQVITWAQIKSRIDMPTTADTKSNKAEPIDEDDKRPVSKKAIDEDSYLEQEHLDMLEQVRESDGDQTVGMEKVIEDLQSLPRAERKAYHKHVIEAISDPALARVRLFHRKSATRLAALDGDSNIQTMAEAGNDAGILAEVKKIDADLYFLLSMSAKNHFRDSKTPVSDMVIDLFKSLPTSGKAPMYALFNEGSAKGDILDIVDGKTLAAALPAEPGQHGTTGVAIDTDGTYILTGQGFYMRVDPEQATTLLSSASPKPISVEEMLDPNGKFTVDEATGSDAKRYLSDAMIKKARSGDRLTPVAIVSESTLTNDQVVLVGSNGATVMVNPAFFANDTNRYEFYAEGTSAKKDRPTTGFIYVYDTQEEKLVAFACVVPKGYDGIAFQPFYDADDHTTRVAIGILGGDADKLGIIPPDVTSKGKKRVVSAKRSDGWRSPSVDSIFARGREGGKIGYQDVMAVVKSFQSIFGGDHQILPVFDSHDIDDYEAQGAISQRTATELRESINGANDIGGMWLPYNGNTILMVPAINSTVSPLSMLIITLVHEHVMHRGFARMMDDPDAFFDRVFEENQSEILSDEKFQRAYAEAWTMRGITADKPMSAELYAQALAHGRGIKDVREQYRFMESVARARRHIAEEWVTQKMETILAERVAGKMKKPPAWYERIIESIRDWLNKALGGLSSGSKPGVGVKFIDVESILSGATFNKDGKIDIAGVTSHIQELMRNRSEGIQLRDAFLREALTGKKSTATFYPELDNSIELSPLMRGLMTIDQKAMSPETMLQAVLASGATRDEIVNSGMAEILDAYRQMGREILPKEVRYQLMRRDGALRRFVRTPSAFERLGIDGVSNAIDWDKTRGITDKKMYVGKNAKNLGTAQTAFDTAEKMLSNGVMPREIWAKTGWIYGRDGVWRYEIDDSKMKLRRDISSMVETMRKSGKTSDTWLLPSVIDHAELFAAYPELKNINVKVYAGADPTRGGYYDRPTSKRKIENIVVFGGDLSQEGFERVLLHEIQHAVQMREGMNRGMASEISWYALNKRERKRYAAEALKILEEDLESHRKQRDLASLLTGKFRQKTEKISEIDNEFRGIVTSDEASEKTRDKIADELNELGHDLVSKPEIAQLLDGDTAQLKVNQLINFIDAASIDELHGTEALADISVEETKNRIDTVKAKPFDTAIGDMISSIPSKEYPGHSIAYQIYMENLGEVDARDTAGRRGYGAKSRARSMPAGLSWGLKTNLSDIDNRSPYELAGSQEFASSPARHRKISADEKLATDEQSRVAKAIEDSRGLRANVTLREKIDNAVGIMYGKFTEAFPDLYPKYTSYGAVVKDKLRQLNDAQKYASTVAGNVLREITNGLTKEDENLLADIIMFRDILGELEKPAEDSIYHGTILPFDFRSEDSVREALAMAESKMSDAVHAALEKRERFMREFTNQLVEQGFLPEDHKDPRSYFRRQVQKHYEDSEHAQKLWASKGKLLGLKHGFEKARTGPGMIRKLYEDMVKIREDLEAKLLADTISRSERVRLADVNKTMADLRSDYNTNYRQMEFEHIAAGFHRMRTTQLVSEMRDLVDVSGELKEIARHKNLVGVYGSSDQFQYVTRLKIEMRGLGKSKEDRTRKKEISEELMEIDPLRPSEIKFAKGLSMLAGSLAGKDGQTRIPPDIPMQYRGLAQDLAISGTSSSNKDDVADEFHEQNIADGFQGFEQGSLFGLMRWLDKHYPGKYSGMGLIYQSIGDKQKVIRETLEASGNEYSTAFNIAEGYSAKQAGTWSIMEDPSGAKASLGFEKLRRFSPDDAHIMYPVQTLADHTIKRMLEQIKAQELLNPDVPATIGADVLEAVLSKTRTAIAFGPLREEWIVPESVAKALESYGNGAPRTSKPLRIWKPYVLMAPHRIVKYSLNNTVGDLDAVIATFPGALSEVKGAIHDLWTMHGHATAGTFTGKNNYRRDAKAKELEMLVAEGVIDNSQSVDELADLEKEYLLYKWPGTEEAAREVLFALKNPARALVEGTKGWFALARSLSSTRESILRLAVYRHVMKMVESGQLPLGMANRSELYNIRSGYDSMIKKMRENNAGSDAIAAKELEKKRVLAAKISRETMGDYGNVTHMGQILRARAVPFWAWLELNTARYLNFITNVFHDETIASPFSRIAAKVGGTTARAAVSAATGAVKASILMAAFTAFNRTFHPDEDDALVGAREQLHMILGKDDEGNIVSLRTQGALSDFLSLLGLEDIGRDITELRNGDKTAKQQFLDIPKGWIDRLVNGFDPMAKSMLESAFGVKSFPSLFTNKGGFERRYSHVRGNVFEQLTNNMFGAPAEIMNTMLFHTPRRKRNIMEWLLTYKVDPGEQAYWRAGEIASEYSAKTGIGAEKGNAAPSDMPIQKALYNYRKAVKYGWTELADYWASKYYEAGGLPGGLSASIRKSGPVSNMFWLDRGNFYKQLRPDQQKIVDRGVDWYENWGKKLLEDFRARPEYNKAMLQEIIKKQVEGGRPSLPTKVDPFGTVIPGRQKPRPSYGLGSVLMDDRYTK